MRLSERLEKIKQLQEVRMPFLVNRTIGKVGIFGDQIFIGEDKDFMSEAEFKEVLTLLVEEMNGTIKWKQTKGEK